MSRKRAPGPYSYDDDEDYVPSKGVKYSEREDVLPVKEKKHTLDSDEEDDENDDGDDDDEGTGGKNYDVLRDEDIDGQEEGTVDFEGETKIMPFNMKEEMEEGHFDGDGFYHFKKESEEIKDAWLDDIDWVKVKHQEASKNKYGSDVESDEGSGDEALPGKSVSDSVLQTYTEIFSYLKPGESLAKALKRLGGNKKISSSQKWKLKKTGKIGNEGDSNNMGDFLKLTELANKVMETGNMDIYEETYEMINLKLERSKAPAPVPSVDMFAEETGQKDSDSKNGETAGEISQNSPITAEVQWQLRWEDKDDAEVHGPFNSEKMLQWQESGYFSKGAFVRKTTDPGQTWYSTRRIDFDLYV